MRHVLWLVLATLAMTPAAGQIIPVRHHPRPPVVHPIVSNPLPVVL